MAKQKSPHSTEVILENLAWLGKWFLVQTSEEDFDEHELKLSIQEIRELLNGDN